MIFTGFFSMVSGRRMQLKKRKRLRSRTRHVHSVSLTTTDSKLVEVETLKALENLLAYPEASVVEEVEEKAQEEEEEIAETVELLPPRPQEGTYLAKLWDNLYGRENPAELEESALERDVKARLREGTKATELLELVREDLRGF